MIEPYDQAKHYEILKSWILKREGCIIFPPDFFPRVGFVSPGIAAGFLYQTDSAFGLVENLIANPDSDRSERDQALNEIVTAIIESAKPLGIKMLIAMSEIEAVKKRILAFGGIEAYRSVTLFMRGV